MDDAAERLADRMRDYFAPIPGLSEKRMFGGLCFLLDGNMVCCVMKGGDMLGRVGKDGYADALALPGCTPMTIGQKTMAGFVAVDGAVLEEQPPLAQWLDRCLAFTASLPPK